MKRYTFIFILLLEITFSYGQQGCSHKFILNHMGLSDLEQEQVHLEENNNGLSLDSSYEFTIPVVLHVFHNGDDNYLTMEQIESSMKILNDDFNGLNLDYNDVIPRFDSIKASLDINFCLASIDENGQPFDGVVYYEDSLAMYNEKDLYAYAWDNERYFNIYIPKWVFDPNSNFTAYATYPNDVTVRQDRDGVHYSGVRFGYGEHSLLEPGQEWASVITHEVGHWLNLRHTFHGGCSGSGDLIKDTPPCQGGTIQLAGCDNNNFSCGVEANGSNYMDYNHDCKRMFTQGQVERMYSALFLPSRSNLWSEDNLIATGCGNISTSNRISSYTANWKINNPTSGKLILNFDRHEKLRTEVYDLSGKKWLTGSIEPGDDVISLGALPSRLYILVLQNESLYWSSKFLLIKE